MRSLPSDTLNRLQSPQRLATRVFFVVLATLTLGWAILDPRFRDAEGAFAALVVLPVSLAVALVIIGLTVGTAWERAGFWLALGLVGQSAALQLINAGWQLRYQHYKPLGDIVTTSPAAVRGLVLVQATLVVIGLAFRAGQIARWARANVRAWQGLVVAFVFLVSHTTVSEDVRFFAAEWVFAGFIQTVNLANVVLIGLSMPRRIGARLRRVLQTFDDEADGAVVPGSASTLIVVLAASVVVLAALLNVQSYERHPHVPDEVIYLTHAQFLASGRLTMPAPVVPEAFEVYLMQVDGDRWYPVPPPGWPMVLAIGALLGVPWLVNPVLAGANLLLAHGVLSELYSRSTARLASVMLAVSPWYLFLGMSFMTHMLALTCALVAALGVARARRTGRAYWGWTAGFALGMLALIRPLEALGVAGLLGLWAIGLGARRLKLSAIAGLIGGAAIAGGAGLLYNAALTGDPLQFPINVYIDQRFAPNANAYGFGADRGMGWPLDPYPGHGPIDALINTNLNVSTINTELFGWSIGSLLPLALLLAYRRFASSDYLMAAPIVVIYGLHFFYYFSGGPDFGARYWFLMIVPLVALTARALQMTAGRFRARFPDGPAHLYLVVAALCVMAMVNFVPWRALDKYRNFRGMRADIPRLAHDYGFGRSLVLIRGNQHPDYDSAMVYNPLDLAAAAPIYAWDRDPETRRRLLIAYADRPVWLVNSPSLTGRGFEVAAGPVAAKDLLEETEK